MSTTEITTYKGFWSELTGTPVYEGNELTSKQLSAFKKVCEAERTVKAEFKKHGLDFGSQYIVVKNYGYQNNYTDYDKMVEEAEENNSEVSSMYPVGGCEGDIIRFTCTTYLEKNEKLYSKIKDTVDEATIPLTTGYHMNLFHRAIDKITPSRKTSNQEKPSDKEYSSPNTRWGLEGFHIYFVLKIKHKNYNIEIEQVITDYNTKQDNKKQFEYCLKDYFSDGVDRNDGDEYVLRPLSNE